MENSNIFLPISQNVGNPPEFFPCIEENRFKSFFPLSESKAFQQICKATTDLLDLQHPTGREEEKYYYSPIQTETFCCTLDLSGTINQNTSIKTTFAFFFFFLHLPTSTHKHALLFNYTEEFTFMKHEPSKAILT